jgi:hypothetical protein
MDNKIRKVDPHTFWNWLTNEERVGDKLIPLSSPRAYMSYPDLHGSEVIILVRDRFISDPEGEHICGEISFRFTRIDNEQFRTRFITQD